MSGRDAPDVAVRPANQRLTGGTISDDGCLPARFALSRGASVYDAALTRPPLLLHDAGLADDAMPHATSAAPASKSHSSPAVTDKPQTAAEQATPNRPRRFIVSWCLVIGGSLLGLLLMASYLLQPDALAALTVIPAWCWVLPGAVILLEARPLVRSPWWVVCLAIWTGYVYTCVEQSHSLVRGWFTSPSAEWTAPAAPPLRIVSLNCLVGSPSVVHDLQPQEPDLALLQESPSEAHLEGFARALFGDEGAVIGGHDCSIIARGRLARIPTPTGARWTQALWEPPAGSPVMVFSIRLSPATTRMDWWNPNCWSTHRGRRELHREQLDQLAAAIASVPAGLPIIVGGDFNSPAGDGAHELLRPRISDAFTTAGRGWGATFSQRFAFHRIDQIWLSPELTALDVQAEIAKHSDHRLVICTAARPSQRGR